MSGRYGVRAFLCAALVAVGLGGLALWTGALGSLERDTVSARFALRGEAPPDDVAVVGIDGPTFSELQTRWPFPRSLHAEMVDRLSAAGAREIVYDVQFTEPTRPSEDLALYRAIGRAGGAVLATGETDGDGSSRVLGGDENLARIDAQAGSANFDNDSGGVVARVPYSAGGLKTLAVVAAERIKGHPVSRSGFGEDGALIDYRGGPRTIPTHSFGDVLRGRVPRSELEDKVVVVGATTPVLQDVHATPTSGGGLMAGPELEANAIWTVLHGVPLRNVAGALNLLLVVLLGIAAPLARLRFCIPGSVAIGLGAGAAFAVIAQIAFDSGWVLAVVPPLVALVAGIAAMVATSALLEKIERLRVAHENEVLERLVRERTDELRETQLEVIHRLAQAAESRDEITGRHILRIGRLSQRLALAAGMGPEEAEMLRHASAMHDVGKIAIPDSVLLKPGPLDEEEWKTMTTHPQAGAEILADSQSPVVQMGRTIALTHHERWDGSGYPAGLAGEEIPLEGRICAICDVFDALLTERPYKQPWALQDVLAEIRKEAGHHFDPHLTELFLGIALEMHAELGYRSPAASAGAAHTENGSGQRDANEAEWREATLPPRHPRRRQRERSRARRSPSRSNSPTAD